MASILSTDYNISMPADLAFKITSSICYGTGMQKSVRPNFFKFPDLEPHHQSMNAGKLLGEFDAVCMASPEAWVEFVGRFMILKPGRDHLRFALWCARPQDFWLKTEQCRFQITVWRYGHRKKKTPLNTTIISIQSTDKLGKDAILNMFNNHSQTTTFDVDIK